MAGQNAKRTVLAAKKFFLTHLIIEGEGSRCDGNGERACPRPGVWGCNPLLRSCQQAAGGTPEHTK